MTTESDKPTEAALLKMLDLQWQDHFQTRTQTWKSLEMVAPMLVALIALDWSSKNPSTAYVAAILLMVAAGFGMAITLKHRNVEIQKFTTIQNLEDTLGFGSLVHNRKLPQPISFQSIFNFRQSNTPLFILRMHFIVFVFALGFLVLRLLGY